MTKEFLKAGSYDNMEHFRENGIIYTPVETSQYLPVALYEALNPGYRPRLLLINFTYM